MTEACSLGSRRSPVRTTARDWNMGSNVGGAGFEPHIPVTCSRTYGKASGTFFVHATAKQTGKVLYLN